MTSPEGSTSVSSCKRCGVGFYASRGTCTSCGTGMTSPEGSTSVSDCSVQMPSGPGSIATSDVTVSEPANSNDQMLAIGLGVGIPAVLILIGALLAFFLCAAAPVPVVAPPPMSPISPMAAQLQYSEAVIKPEYVVTERPEVIHKSVVIKEKAMPMEMPTPAPVMESRPIYKDVGLYDTVDVESRIPHPSQYSSLQAPNNSSMLDSTYTSGVQSPGDNYRDARFFRGNPTGNSLGQPFNGLRPSGVNGHEYGRANGQGVGTGGGLDARLGFPQ